MAANHEDCLTSLQSCFSTREIYSCIVDFFFFFRGERREKSILILGFPEKLH